MVETIAFDDGEDEELPPPLTLRDVITMNKTREQMEAMAIGGEGAAGAPEAAKVGRRAGVGGWGRARWRRKRVLGCCESADRQSKHAVCSTGRGIWDGW